MREDPILKDWGLVKRNFVGTVAEPVPPIFFNRLLELVPAKIRKANELEPEQVTTSNSSGRYSLEEEFEREYLEPLFRRWGVRFVAQHPCVVFAGRQKYTCRVDFLLQDDKGPITVFESKLKITNNDDLESALMQGRSYAMHLGLNSFVVAAPEGFWIYAIEKNVHSLVENVSLETVDSDEERTKNLILSLR